MNGRFVVPLKTPKNLGNERIIGKIREKKCSPDNILPKMAQKFKQLRRTQEKLEKSESRKLKNKKKIFSVPITYLKKF